MLGTRCRLFLARTWGGEVPPGDFLSWTPNRLRWRADFLYGCISNCSPDSFKISSPYDLWFVKYDLVLEVMSDSIFAKFDIAPKAQL